MTTFPELADLEAPEPDGPGTGVAAAPAPSAKRDLYLAHLAAEGFRPKVDDGGVIAFRFEGKTLLLFVSDDDPAFFRLACPAVYECEDDEHLLALRAANRVNQSFKVGKVVVSDGGVWAGVEMFLAEPAWFEPVFGRCLDLVSSMAGGFRRMMEEARD